MRKVWVWTVVLLAFYALQTFAYQTNWGQAVVGLEKRVVRLEMMTEDGDQGVCSGAVLNAVSGFVVTAQHCVDSSDKHRLAALTVNGRHAEVVRQNKLLDIAVVRTELKGAASITIAAQTPIVGSEVAILGYAFGAKKLHMQFGRVSLPLDDDGALVIDAMVIAGDSGGPTINAAGELVGLTSFIKYNGPMMLGYMVTAEKVKDFVEQYLPKP